MPQALLLGASDIDFKPVEAQELNLNPSLEDISPSGVRATAMNHSVPAFVCVFSRILWCSLCSLPFKDLPGTTAAWVL